MQFFSYLFLETINVNCNLRFIFESNKLICCRHTADFLIEFHDTKIDKNIISMHKSSSESVNFVDENFL